MGTEKPVIKSVKTSARKFNFLAFIKICALLSLSGMLYLALDSVPPALKPQEEARLQKRLREIDDSEQYALVAEFDGWYPCLHSGQTSYYLLAGETWKYGVTSKGKFGRYSVDFFATYSVTYIVQFRGNFAECLKQEQIQLFNYPYLPENLARPPGNRLPRPPYNPVMR